MKTFRATKTGKEEADLTNNPMYNDVLKYAEKYGIEIVEIKEALTTNSLYISFAKNGTFWSCRVSDHDCFGRAWRGNLPGIAIRKAVKGVDKYRNDIMSKIDTIA